MTWHLRHDSVCFFPFQCFSYAISVSIALSVIGFPDPYCLLLGSCIGYIFLSFMRMATHGQIGGWLLLCLFLYSKTLVQCFRFYAIVII